MTTTVKELSKIRHALVSLRNREKGVDAFNSFEDAINAINRHPLLKAARAEALDEMARLGQEFESWERSK